MISKASVTSASTLRTALRSHCCGELTGKQNGIEVKLIGWLHRVRDHGDLRFLDLRDHYGITQCVVEQGDPAFASSERIPLESVLAISGKVTLRSAETVNNELATGEIEIKCSKIAVVSQADPLPMPVNQEADYPEEIKLRHRYLDLRRPSPHHRIMLRNDIIASLRRRMQEVHFLEINTPLLTASAPEGARDFLVPSRLHPGKFYALPQAPQLFKQLLMVSGFDRYFQIAPCFRDEAARADRSPGEFYQLDLEIAFVTQADVFAILEPILAGLFREFAGSCSITSSPFPIISHAEALRDYGSDKPDLRNPLLISDISVPCNDTDLQIFSKCLAAGGKIRAVRAPAAATKPRSWFDKLNAWAKAEGQAGLGYITWDHSGAKGPIARHLSQDTLQEIAAIGNCQAGDALFIIASSKPDAVTFSGSVRQKLAVELELIKPDCFQFCWISDFPLYERDSDSGAIQFSHNPFSMPQGGMESLRDLDPLAIKAWQYDIVCNGVELSSGAIRNHEPETLIEAFRIAGYSRQQVETQFKGFIQALRYGAPPHGGSAPGIERILMLLLGANNLREVVAFPFNQTAQDLMLGAPTEVDNLRLKEYNLMSIPD